MLGEYQLLPWINPEKLNWSGLSRNNHEWVIAQLKLHPEKNKLVVDYQQIIMNGQ